VWIIVESVTPWKGALPDVCVMLRAQTIDAPDAEIQPVQVLPHFGADLLRTWRAFSRAAATPRWSAAA
jgi:hypothetical protein